MVILVYEPNPHSAEAQSCVWSVSEADCVTTQASLSHPCVPQDTTVLRGPLLLNPALRSVLCGCDVCPAFCPQL